MRKYFRWPILGKAALLITALSAVVALINLASYGGSVFRIGFPSPIVTIFLDKAASPAFHVNLAGLTLDMLLAYAVCWLIDQKKQSK